MTSRLLKSGVPLSVRWIFSDDEHPAPKRPSIKVAAETARMRFTTALPWSLTRSLGLQPKKQARRVHLALSTNREIRLKVPKPAVQVACRKEPLPRKQMAREANFE